MSANAKPWSLFRHLVIGFGASYFLLLLATLGLLYALLARGLEAEKAAILTDRADAVIALLKSPAHGMAELHRRIEQEWPGRSGVKIFVRVQDAERNVIAESPDFPPGLATFLAAFAPPADPRSESSAHCRPLPLPDPGYLGCFRTEDTVAARPGGPVRVFTVTSREESTGFLLRFRELAVLVLLLSLLASAGIGWLMARRGMRPIHAIAGEVGRFGTHNLNERILVAGLPVELHGLAEAFNRSLVRIEESFQRLSRFSDDIAHELRTPLNNMMGEVEVALGRPRSAGEYAEILSSNLEECARLIQLVESMLFLARAENLDYQLRAVPLDVAAELATIREFFEPAASEKAIRLTVVEAPAGAPVMVKAEPQLFQRAVGNLLANAIHYTPAGGEVRLAFWPARGRVEVTVSDTGVGIAPEHLGKIFERFYRVDYSRNLNLGGFGLGLAIVKSIVALHGGQVAVESAPGRGTTFRTSWPADA